jgi:hypothetical protein
MALVVFSFTSCKVSKQYVTYISKKADIVAPKTKKIVVIATDDIKVLEFTKTFEKNYEEKADFSSQYLTDFSNKVKARKVFGDVTYDISKGTYASLKSTDADYVIHFSNFEITNRYEWRQSGNMGGMNGTGYMNTSSSVEYCVINVKVEVYDAKNDKEIIDFIAIGEASVFFFNFTTTLKKAKDRTIDHIINYLKTEQTTYEKY